MITHIVPKKPRRGVISITPHKKISDFRSVGILLIVCAMLCSCEKVVEFDIDDTGRQVVVNALPCTDSTLFVNITYSRFFLDNQSFQPVADATATLIVNGTTLTATQRDGANHLFAYTVNAGDSLTLNVDIPGLPTITAATRAVPLPDISGLVAQIDTLQPITAGEVSFTLTDPAAQRGRYLIYISERDSGSRWNAWEERWDTIDTVAHSYFLCTNREITAPEVNRAEGMMDYFTQLLFTDSLIDGQQYDVLLSIPMFRDTAEHPIQRDYTLVVETLSPEAFRYIVDVQNAQSLGQYFAEPAQIYSNLSSGLGIFAAIARRQFPLTFTFKENEEE